MNLRIRRGGYGVFALLERSFVGAGVVEKETN
jgi:hypothetical protein